LAGYVDLVFGGWDVRDDDLALAAAEHGVLDAAQQLLAAPALGRVKPWPAIGSGAFCAGVQGGHRVSARGHREAIAQVQSDLDRFALESEVDAVVVVNLASTERWVDPALPVFADLPSFERGLDRDGPDIGPAMLYAYAALTAGVPYANFTPSLAVDVPALRELAGTLGVPVAGRDGKTGQTLLKTVLAPALRARALTVEGWYSTNILGNRDGEALHHPASLASKVATKGSVLDHMLGYPVDDHVVQITYYRPRGDDKESWDNIDVRGFLGQRMQLKLNFLCRDSILAAPLVLELARLLDLAAQRGHAGVVEPLGVFFKAPMTRDGNTLNTRCIGKSPRSRRGWAQHDQRLRQRVGRPRGRRRGRTGRPPCHGGRARGDAPGGHRRGGAPAGRPRSDRVT